MVTDQPTGHPVAAAVAPFWPHISENTLQTASNQAQARSSVVGERNDALGRSATRLESAWRGESGTAAIDATRQIKLVGDDFETWERKMTLKFRSGVGILTAFKKALRDLFERGKAEYDSLPQNNALAQAQRAVIAKYLAEAEGIQSYYIGQAAEQALPIPPPDIAKLPRITPRSGNVSTNGTSPNNGRVRAMGHESTGGSDEVSGGQGDALEKKPKVTGHDSKAQHGTEGDAGDKNSPDNDLVHKKVETKHDPMGQHGTEGDAGTNQGQPGVGSATGQGLTPLTSAMQSMSPGGGGGSPASAMGGLSSLSSGFNPAQGLHGAGQAGSGAVRPAAMSSSPLTSMTQGFGSGLSSGMSATSSGGGFPAQAAQSTGLTPAQQVASHFIGPTSPPAAAAPTPAAVNPAMSAPPAPPAQPGAAGPVGGTGMLGPYSTPTGGGSAGVAAAGAAGGAGSAGAGGGAAPGGSTSSGAATLAPVPPPDERVSTPARPGKNPDLVLAESVVADLVRGAPMSVSEWAVSVIRTAAGPQVVVAGNVAGGSFIPQGVFLPSGARLAATDPSLPANWWLPFMGWPRPVDILLEHFDRLTQAVHGVTLAAIATTTALDRLPGHVRVPYGVVARQDVTGRAPVLDGGHQHRLATFDPSLLGRVKALRPDIAFNAAAGLTRAVIDAAQEATEKAGDAPPLYHADDREILDLVSKEAATQQDWAKYTAVAYEADVAPSTYATHSYDDQPETQREREAYWVRFRRARVMELVSCWEKMPPSLPDVVYAAIHAGFQPAQIITQAEQIQQSGGQS